MYQDQVRLENYLDTTMFRYQKQLDEQVKVQETEKEKMVQQFLKEKEMIDDVVRKIQRENEAMTLKRMMDKKATKEQVPFFFVHSLF